MHNVISAMIAHTWRKPFLYGLDRKDLSEEERFELRYEKGKERTSHRKKQNVLMS